MWRISIVIVSGLLLLLRPQLTAQSQAGVTLVATGATVAAQAVSKQLLTVVQQQLKQLEKVSPRGDILVLPRAELNPARQLEYMRANDANASVVMDFAPEPATNFGFAHLTVTVPANPAPAPAILPNAGGRRGPVSPPGAAPGRTISEYLNPKAVKPWQFENFAAFIIERTSGGREIRVQLWVYITPRGSVFSVGNSDPVMASDPGRSDNEGFRLWVGTQPQGTTVVEISHPPDYVSVKQPFTVPNSADGKYERSIQAVLHRNP